MRVYVRATATTAKLPRRWLAALVLDLQNAQTVCRHSSEHTHICMVASMSMNLSWGWSDFAWFIAKDSSWQLLA